MPGIRIVPVNVMEPFGQVVVGVPGLHLPAPEPDGKVKSQKIVKVTLPLAVPPVKNFVALYEHERGLKIYLAAGSLFGQLVLISKTPSPFQVAQTEFAHSFVGVGLGVFVVVGVVVEVGVFVGVGVTLFVGVTVGVTLFVGVTVGVTLMVGVTEIVGVMLGVGVEVGI